MVAIFTAGCETTPSEQNYNRITSISLSSLNNQIAVETPVEISQVLSKSMFLKKNNLDIEINLQSASVIDKNGEKYLARAFEVDSDVRALKLTSHIIPVKQKADYLFFPSFSAFDREKRSLGKVTPENDYQIDHGILTVSFSVPMNTKYVLLHTEPEYLTLGSIDGKNGGLHPSINYSDQDLSIGIGAVLGGAIGGVVAAARSVNSYYKVAPSENYFFGPGGIIDIKLID